MDALKAQVASQRPSADKPFFTSPLYRYLQTSNPSLATSSLLSSIPPTVFLIHVDLISPHLTFDF